MTSTGWGIVKMAPPETRNGLPPAVPYVYRGTKTLEAELPVECPGGCGRRLESLKHGKCAVCRGSKYYDPDRCDRCGYKPGGRSCKARCG